jgi:hypothetical protein
MFQDYVIQVFVLVKHARFIVLSCLMNSFQSQDYLYRNILMVILYPNLYNTIIKTNFMKAAFFETTKA